MSKRIGRIVAVVIAVTAIATGVAGCASQPQEPRANPADTTAPPTTTTGGENVKTIYIAGGCFWGVEKYIGQVQGVLGTEVGYTNGSSDSATYGDGTGYTEAVKVDYDPQIAPLPFLLDLFYDAIDPTSVNRQGNDVGVEYRTGIYYTDPADRQTIDESIAKLQQSYTRPIAIEVAPLKNYTTAEEYHQDYLTKNPDGYCHIPRKLFDAAAAARP